ncbi:hypothetical protein J5X98_13600 [Leptothermofonsia sichuanensis E412]|uniref:hypothetical protein n=1 Tax=Leptothermofonsia sichuanensis TaxID=2917832 RepID=UPI001CA732F8|nr:hypothetical protein [Leptothermofonsia sichuanensis]QZZ23273.1 hypothetical protein J5X98_13600 [Leptothermofonsia sichuanensis E412]
MKCPVLAVRVLVFTSSPESLPGYACGIEAGQEVGDRRYPHPVIAREYIATALSVALYRWRRTPCNQFRGVSPGIPGVDFAADGLSPVH